ncbi:MAG: efflux RND transporter periplasmic adaptor subunit [Chloroflexi bacterium]|nr:efflux RND transporter periplasmic adaptor subunit [Chloroflexota bacterium]
MKIKLWILISILTLILVACGSSSDSTVIPTVVLDSGTGGDISTPQPVHQTSGAFVTASGVIRPVQDAQLSFGLGGNIKKIYVAEGDLVKAGDILAELDNTFVQIELDQAQRTLREMTSQAAIAAAEQSVVIAQKAYEDAGKRIYSNDARRGDQDAIDYYKAQLVLAQKALDNAREAYNMTSGKSSADPVRAAATTNLFNAQKAYNTALANLDWFSTKPSENDVALVNAELDAATAALQEAKWYLSELKGESIPADATGSQLAQLQQVRDNLKAAQNKLEHTRLVSPFSGAVAGVNFMDGEFVSPGQMVIAISDVTNLQVVTTDLSERDISQVKIGQNVMISIEALNVEIKGRVISISPVSDTLGGDVVYKTVISLDERPEGIRAGMSAVVQIQTGE